jgi:ribonucleotide monophosphatase NagD (HAD superfamily)
MSWVERPIKGVLLDISGVLRDGDYAIPGSIEAFER